MRPRTILLIHRLMSRAFRRWVAAAVFGETRAEEDARQRYVALVDIANAWALAPR